MKHEPGGPCASNIMRYSLSLPWCEKFLTVSAEASMRCNRPFFWQSGVFILAAARKLVELTDDVNQVCLLSLFSRWVFESLLRVRVNAIAAACLPSCSNRKNHELNVRRCHFTSRFSPPSPQTAIFSTNFSTSARKAFFLIARNTRELPPCPFWGGSSSPS